MSKKSDFIFEKVLVIGKFNGIYFVRLTFSKLIRMSDNQTLICCKKINKFLKFSA